MKLKDLEKLKNTDIQEVGNIYETRASNIKEEERVGYFIDDEMLEEDMTVIFADLNDLIDETDYNCCDYNEEIFDEFVGELIKDSNNYLLVNYGGNWRNLTGYKFVHSLEECFIRSYDCSQYVMGGTTGNKVLSIRESHHDCPMGAEMLIIALTDSEFEKLECSSFDEIIEFGNKKKECVKYVK